MPKGGETSKCKSPVVEGAWECLEKGRTRMCGGIEEVGEVGRDQTTQGLECQTVELRGPWGARENFE